MSNKNVLEIVPTKAMLLRAKQGSEFKVTVFDSSKTNERPNYEEIKKERAQELKRILDEKNQAEDSDGDIFSNRKSQKQQTKKHENAISLKQAARDVFKLGLTGFSSKTKKELLVDAAIKLGAKKPKNSYKNYKEILKDKKESKMEALSQSKFYQLGKNKSGKALGHDKGIRPTRFKKKPESINKHYGVVKPKMHTKMKKK